MVLPLLVWFGSPRIVLSPFKLFEAMGLIAALLVIRRDMESRRRSRGARDRRASTGEAGDASRAQGLGLRSLRYRATLLGGAFEIEENPRGGTTVAVVYPDAQSGAQSAHQRGV
ncbi:MAG: hypothetical protein ACHBNF_03245 [Chromatiales bacterium]